jgi:excisionase family DNA binding protein
MPATQLRLVTPTPRRPVRRPAIDEQVINLTVAADERLLLTVPDAAHRLGISRSMMYELIAAGEVETLRIGRPRKVSVEALSAFVDRQRLRHEGS